MQTYIRLQRSKITLIAIFSLFCNIAFSQLFYSNNSLVIVDGTILFIDGSFENAADGNFGMKNNAKMYVEEDWQNDNGANFASFGTNNGDLYVKGDWIKYGQYLRNNINVHLWGEDQNIIGDSTWFYNLYLSNSIDPGVRRYKTIINSDQYVENILGLDHMELATQAYKMSVENTSTASITRETGFVSSLSTGALLRKTNVSSTYLFPTGSSAGTFRYRPVEIIPLNSGTTEQFGVRFANVNASTETFDLDNKDDNICQLMPDWYHRIYKEIGTGECNDIKIYFDESNDGYWDGLANWQFPTWDIVSTSGTTTASPMSFAYTDLHTLTTKYPFVLYRVAPTVIITNPGDICSNEDPVQLVGTPAGGTWSSSTGAQITTSGLLTPNSATTGEHTIKYTVSMACDDSGNLQDFFDTTIIEIKVAPNAQITNTQTSFCETDDVVTLTGTPTSGTWTSSTSGAVSGNEFYPSIAGIGGHDITYSVTENGCKDTDTKSFNVIDTPDATIINPDTVFCSNDATYTFTATTIGGTWSGTGINSSTGVFNPQGLDGIYKIKYSVGNTNCLDADSVTIRVKPAPNVEITNTNTTFCASDPTVTLTGTPSGGTWTSSIPAAVSGSSFYPSTGANNYNIIYSVTVEGCTESDTKQFTVVNTPDATIINPNTIFCSNDATYTFTATTTGGTWSGTGINSSTGVFNPQGLNGNYTIKYSVGNTNCLDTDSVIIKVNPAPSINISTSPTDPTITCTTTNITLTASGGNSYLWSTGTANSQTTVTTGATYTVTVTSTDGCTNSANINIGQNNTPPTATITPSASSLTCANPNITLTAGSGTSYSWNTGATGNQISVTSQGTYAVTVKNDTNGCTNSTSINIQQTDTPVIASITPSSGTLTCANPNISLMASGGNSYLWNTGSTNATITVTSAGTYTVTATGSTGCTSFANVTIGSNMTPPTVTINQNSQQTFCSKDSPYTFIATPAGGTWQGTGINSSTGLFDPDAAPIGQTRLTYTFGSGVCTANTYIDITVNQTPIININSVLPMCVNSNDIQLSADPAGGIWTGSGIANPEQNIFSPENAGIGNHTITYYIGGMCPASSSITIHVQQIPEAIIKKPVAPVCYDHVKYFSLEALAGNGTWFSQYNQLITEDGVFDVQKAGEGTHKVYYGVAFGDCISIDSVMVTIYPGNMQANYIIDNPVCYGYPTTVDFTVTGGTEPYRYEWRMDDYRGFSDTSFIAGFRTGIYDFTITDGNGCYHILRNLVLREGFEDCIKIPNAFTPNEDGINDLWLIENIESYPVNNIVVYNRWGQKLFEAPDGSFKGWDGKYKGKELPTGSYIYIISLRPGVDEITGIVTIAR